MVGKLYSQVSADRIELVIHQSRPCFSGTLDRAGEWRQGRVYTVILEAVPENAAVEAAVMGYQKVGPDECLHERPCLIEGRSTSNIAHPNAMDGGKGGYDLHTVRGSDECVELIDQFTLPYLD